MAEPSILWDLTITQFCYTTVGRDIILIGKEMNYGI